MQSSSQRNHNINSSEAGFTSVVEPHPSRSNTDFIQVMKLVTELVKLTPTIDFIINFINQEMKKAEKKDLPLYIPVGEFHSHTAVILFQSLLLLIAKEYGLTSLGMEISELELMLLEKEAGSKKIIIDQESKEVISGSDSHQLIMELSRLIDINIVPIDHPARILDPQNVIGNIEERELYMTSIMSELSKNNSFIISITGLAHLPALYESSILNKQFHIAPLATHYTFLAKEAKIKLERELEVPFKDIVDEVVEKKKIVIDPQSKVETVTIFKEARYSEEKRNQTSQKINKDLKSIRVQDAKSIITNNVNLLISLALSEDNELDLQLFINRALPVIKARLDAKRQEAKPPCLPPFAELIPAENRNKRFDNYQPNSYDTLQLYNVTRSFSQQIISNNKQPHALLLSGMAGVGKSHLAIAIGYDATSYGLNVLFLNDDYFFQSYNQFCNADKMRSYIILFPLYFLLHFDSPNNNAILILFVSIG